MTTQIFGAPFARTTRRVRCLQYASQQPALSSFLDTADVYSNNHNHNHNHHNNYRRLYFTNTDKMKEDDPYAQLGLQWGDATSTRDIQTAFRTKARELHPDVNTKDPPAVALRKFQALQKAYHTLLGKADDTDEGLDEWRFAVWRNGDRIAQDRTDVAGVARKRPVQPASKADAWAARQLGHPDGRGTLKSNHRRADYLADGTRTTTPVSSSSSSSSVGTGRNKWVTPKAFVPWNPEPAHQVRASHYAAPTKPSQDTTNHKKPPPSTAN